MMNLFAMLRNVAARLVSATSSQRSCAARQTCRKRARCPATAKPRPKALAVQQGTSLIEVLVSLVIVAISVLGAASLQVNALKFNTAAKDHAAASILAYNIIDRMRANRGAALNGSYDIDLDDDAPSGTALPATDLQQWLNALNERLPGGDASISRSNQTFTITVQWQEARLKTSREANAASTESYRFVTEL
ncbi:type IV pilus modification protein PilV [Zhongshania sp.]|uniref:type IV pilus modification protein PilV n=1 Tax=Zhongshania sp. TaxID=1971902 RepID=UPI003567F812